MNMQARGAEQILDQWLEERKRYRWALRQIGFPPLGHVRDSGWKIARWALGERKDERLDKAYADREEDGGVEVGWHERLRNRAQGERPDS